VGVTVGNRSPVLAKAFKGAQAHQAAPEPLCDVLPVQAPAFDEAGASSHWSSDMQVPLWQNDVGYCASAKVTPRQERQSIIKSLTALGQIGVILDQTYQVIDGTAGWAGAVQSLATMKVSCGFMRPVSPVSNDDFTQAMARIQFNQIGRPIAIILRDLDGWGRDIVQLLPVGDANPDCVLVLFPKSHSAIAGIFEDLAHGLGLSGSEIAIGKLLLLGRVDTEIATTMNIDMCKARTSVKAILHKFRVRRGSDLIALCSRLP
jgi:hypothetical protein